MKGYLFVSNSSKPDSIIHNSVEPINPDSFSDASIWAADRMGWKLYLGVNRKFPEKIRSKVYDIKFYNQNCFRSIFDIKNNWKAYKNLCNFLKENPDIEFIHCNTPIGGVVGRLAGKKFKKKVIYTAHGFHFFKGAPLFNRTILKWIEKYLSTQTDVLITINNEDYLSAQKFKLKTGGKIFKISGVGINLNKFKGYQPNLNLKNSFQFSSSDFICISMGDVIRRKNYITAINAIKKINDKKIHYLICGTGPETKYLENYSKEIGLMSQIHFLGFRKDITDILSISNCFLFTSLQEGLPRSTMEAMASGLPCIVSDIRGNRDLIDEGKGGFLIPPTDINGFAKAINTLRKNPELCQKMGEYNKDKIKGFDIEIVRNQMLDIFKQIEI